MDLLRKVDRFAVTGGSQAKPSMVETNRNSGGIVKKMRKVIPQTGKTEFQRLGVIMVRAAVLFVLAGLAEIGGGYLVWLWLREDKPYWYGIIGGVILFLYGIIPTLQSFPHFGRIYAAYGGVFIVLSLLWGWGIDRKPPDLYDGIGAAICLIGIYIILWGPRNQTF